MVYYIKIEKDGQEPRYIWSKTNWIASEYYKRTVTRYCKIPNININFGVFDDTDEDASRLIPDDEIVVVTSSNNNVAIMTNGIYSQRFECDGDLYRIRYVMERNMFKLAVLCLKYCKDKDIADTILIMIRRLKNCDVDTLDYLCSFHPFYENYLIK